jgi:hypothetical protein
MWDALSGERLGPKFTIASGHRQLSLSQVRLLRDWWTYFTVSNLWLHQTGGEAPVFVSPRNRLAQLHPQALVWLRSPSNKSSKFKFNLYCDRRSVGQFVLVSGPLWGPWPDFLWREDGFVTNSAIADWSGHWEPITIHYRLIWDCVPASSPLTTRRYKNGVMRSLRHLCACPLSYVESVDLFFSKLVEIWYERLP